MFPIRTIVPFAGYPPSRLFGAGYFGHEHHSGPPSFGHMHHHYPFHVLNHSTLGLSEVTNEKDMVQVKIDVQQFSADELSVKAVDNFLIIEGNHGEKEDVHGMISRSFKRRYRLPDDINPDDFDERVSCELSVDGVLTVVIRRKPSTTEANEKVIPITQTGQAHK